eukprot:8900284-Ditylum_brightwellii.AAC.1
MSAMTAHFPVGFDDVVTLISDRRLYNTKKQQSWHQIWMMQYGIYRYDYGEWLRDLEKLILIKHKVRCATSGVAAKER